MAKKDSTPQFSLEAVFNNLDKRKKLEGFIQELAQEHNEIRTHKDAIADIRTNANDTLGIPAKVLNKLVKEHLKPGVIDAEAKEIEEIKDISDALNGVTVKTANFTKDAPAYDVDEEDDERNDDHPV
jgi:hypothetical protein